MPFWRYKYIIINNNNDWLLIWNHRINRNMTLYRYWEHPLKSVLLVFCLAGEREHVLYYTSTHKIFFILKTFNSLLYLHHHRWQAELEGPVGTPYEGKFFQLKLIFCQQYPAVAPRGFFLTKIYHPNVDISTGAICVNTLKKDWTSATTLSHILNVIRCLLIVPFPESSLNDEAGKLFMESYSEYCKRAKLMADVHGRTTSYDAARQQQPVIGENTDTNRNTDSLDKGSRILKSSLSDIPLRTNSNTQNSNSSKNIASSNANKKMLVKQKSKSLKRL
jgi:ubiquitin-conjugating enzyme E2 S